MLSSCDLPLCQAYDLLMLDLDGVVYIGSDPVAHAAAAIGEARKRGAHINFVTNNAARTPQTVARAIAKTGVEADPHEVVTSAQAAARLVRERFGPGTRVLALGAAGLWTALEEAGLVCERDVNADVDCVVTGYGPDVLWRDIMRVATRVKEGLPWVATNTDGSIPTPFGIAPGHGVLVEMLQRFTGVVPDVAGKPSSPLLETTIARTGARRPLMVGDRLDTDIEGANNLGIDSLLVLTGVTTLGDLVAAPAKLRPTFLSADLRGVLRAHASPVESPEGWVSGGWTAQVWEGTLNVVGDGSDDNWWSAAAAASWAWLDTSGTAPQFEHLTPPAPK